MARYIRSQPSSGTKGTKYTICETRSTVSKTFSVLPLNACETFFIAEFHFVGDT